jgi:hypothetical protein
MRQRLGERGLLGHDKRAIISFEANKRKYCASNPHGLSVLRYEIDGKMVTTGERCDYGMGVPRKGTVYLIELKGSDLKKAVRQINSTMDVLGEKLDGYIVHGRVVLSRISRPDLRASRVIALERRLIRSKGRLRKECSILTEEI